MIPPRITIDASHTAGSGKNTGIERVVRNLCQQFEIATGGRGLATPTVATHIQGEFFSIDPRQRLGLKRLSRWEANARGFVPGWIQAIPIAIAKTLQSKKMHRWMHPEPSHLGGYKVPHHLYYAGVQGARYLRGSAWRPTSSDMLLLPDAYWTMPEIWRTVERHRRAGAFVVTLVYDLIPITHPQFVGQKRSQKFRKYVENVVQHSDLIVAISQTVRDDVVRFIETEMPKGFEGACRDVRAFTLGAEIGYSQGSVRPTIETLFSEQDRNTPYLMVGSFDPRKNHHQAIDAFERLWVENPQLKLCMFGRVGAMCADVIERIHKHPRLNHGLYVFHDANDAELLRAYKNCSGVLLPSFVEGFGLPIVESLWHGKKTFASDTPIHREVGGNQCEYFDLNSPESLASAILHWESSRNHMSPSQLAMERYIPMTWEQSAGQLLDVCVDAFYLNRYGVPHARAA
jgi:alpha-1,2-rhamnosyltransferase